MGSQTKPSDNDNHGIFDGISVSLFPGWQQRAKAALHAVKRKGHKKLPKMPSPLAGRITGKYLFHVIDEKPAKDGVDADPANRVFNRKAKARSERSLLLDRKQAGNLVAATSCTRYFRSGELRGCWNSRMEIHR